MVYASCSFLTESSRYGEGGGLKITGTPAEKEGSLFDFLAGALKGGGRENEIFALGKIWPKEGEILIIHFQ